MEIILWAGIIVILLFIAIYIWGETRTEENVKAIQKGLARGPMNTVSAGSHYKDIPRQKECVSPKYNLFRDSYGHQLPTAEFDSYLVQGDSMQFCDILTGDVVFAKKGFRVSDILKFPTVVIIRNLKAAPDQCQYKIRRAWSICPNNLDEAAYKEIVKSIMASPDYQILKAKASDIYESDDVMLDGFMSKIKGYQDNCDPSSPAHDIVILSTYDVDNKKIRFSVHSASSLMGIVSYVAAVATA